METAEYKAILQAVASARTLEELDRVTQRVRETVPEGDPDAEAVGEAIAMQSIRIKQGWDR